MTQQTKRLTAILDELVNWLNDNPAVKVPSDQKIRIQHIFDNLIYRIGFSEEVWLKIKPEPKPNTRPALSKRDHIRRENSKLAKELREKINQINHPFESAFKKNTVKTPFKPITVKKDNAITKTITKGGKKYIVCPDCNAEYLNKNSAKHKKHCPVKKKNQNTKKTKAPKIKGSYDNGLQKNERNMDGAKGYHSFARENGRFGSHSSFDNMGDESRP